MKRRINKVNELLKQELAKMAHEAVPISLGLTTITDVIVTDDIKNAVVFVSCFEKENSKAILKILDDNKKEFQKILGKKLTMRFTPKIDFKLDNAQEKIDKVEQILGKI